jgi:hypothetical protein
MSQMSGFLLRPITSGKVTENQKGAMLSTGKEAKTELRQLQKDGNLPTALDPLDEER